jgi:hypothetical protein
LTALHPSEKPHPTSASSPALPSSSQPAWYSFLWENLFSGEYPEDPDDSLGGLGGSQLVREMNLRLLGDKDYFITPVLDMVARVEDFNMHELLEWTRILIRVHLGDPEPELVKGDFEDFNGAHSHVSEICRISQALAAGIPEDEIINYRTGDSEKRDMPKLLTSGRRSVTHRVLFSPSTSQLFNSIQSPTTVAVFAQFPGFSPGPPAGTTLAPIQRVSEQLNAVFKRRRPVIESAG